MGRARQAMSGVRAPKPRKDGVAHIQITRQSKENGGGDSLGNPDEVSRYQWFRSGW